MTGESFPLKARAKGLSMTTAANWLLNFAIAYATPYMVDSGPGNANLGSKVFFVWGGYVITRYMVFSRIKLIILTDSVSSARSLSISASTRPRVSAWKKWTSSMLSKSNFDILVRVH